MKKALLFAVAIGVAGLTVSHADARSRHTRSAQPAAETVLPPNVSGAYGYSPAPGFGPFSDGGQPGYNGPAYDSYDTAGPFGPHISRSMH